jgi:methionyl-tRNA synthetase
MLARYNANLANGLGNLASRVLAMLESYFDGEVPEPGPQAHWAELRGTVDRHTSGYHEHMENLALTQAVAAATEIVVRANGYLVEKAPWATSRDPARREELAAVLYAATEVLRILAILLWPVMPGAMERLWEQLGIEGHLSAQRLPDAAGWGRLEPGTGIRRGEALFPRLDE